MPASMLVVLICWSAEKGLMRCLCIEEVKSRYSFFCTTWRVHMDSNVSKELYLELIKKASQLAVSKGLIKTGLPEHIAEGLAEQFSVAHDMVATAAVKGTVSPEKL